MEQSRSTSNAGAVLLERSGERDALDEHARAVRADGHGRLVLISGEAGIGKTSLLRAFVAAHRDTRLLAGACDALYTPRPLGPLLDIAEEAGGDLAAAARERTDDLRRRRALARGGPPTVVAVGGDHERRDGLEPAGEEAQHVERRAVGPVDVLEYQGGRRPAAQLARELRHDPRRRRALAGGGREVAARLLGDVEQRAERPP